MLMDNTTKTLIAVVCVAVLLYVVYEFTKKPTVVVVESEKQQDKSLEKSQEKVDNFDDVSVSMMTATEGCSHVSKDSKMYGKNSATCGYKKANYADGDRQNKGEWMNYFSEPIIGVSATGPNDGFMPMDETNGSLAVFKGTDEKKVCGSNQECSPEDLFDIDKYLPQEVNDDWFEVAPEAVSVKNRHLINIVKPIGVNTLVESNKNASYDIRGTPSCPKFVVSPWNQSSIEADIPYRKLN